jgi:hypothetical protein
MSNKTETVLIVAQFGTITEQATIAGPKYPKLRKRHPAMSLAIQAQIDSWKEKHGKNAVVSQVF